MSRIETLAEDKHDYLSTACHHGRHFACRLKCKFCQAPCKCGCHTAMTLEEIRETAAVQRVLDANKPS
jgi:pyruvate-formate lyase-activating enzyme